MTDRSVAERPALPNSLDEIADRIEEEIAHLREKRPHLEDRIDRAAGILVTHLACPRQRVIRVRVSGSRPRFLVNGSGGNVYSVSPRDWSCSCPDHHRRGAACKHALSCWVLKRASLPAGIRLRDCDGCKQPFARRDLVEITHEHQSEQWFPGDRICRSCADSSGIEW